MPSAKVLDIASSDSATTQGDAFVDKTTVHVVPNEQTPVTEQEGLSQGASSPDAPKRRKFMPASERKVMEERVALLEKDIQRMNHEVSRAEDALADRKLKQMERRQERKLKEQQVPDKENVPVVTMDPVEPILLNEAGPDTAEVDTKMSRRQSDDFDTKVRESPRRISDPADLTRTVASAKQGFQGKAEEHEESRTALAAEHVNKAFKIFLYFIGFAGIVFVLVAKSTKLGEDDDVDAEANIIEEHTTSLFRQCSTCCSTAAFLKVGHKPSLQRLPSQAFSAW